MQITQAIVFGLSLLNLAHAGFKYEPKVGSRVHEEAREGIRGSDRRLDEVGCTLVQPAREPLGIPTLNFGGGFMNEDLNDSMKAILNRLSERSKVDRVLDIGSAYGVATQAILRQFPRSEVIANDIGPENLIVLRKGLSRPESERVFLNSDRFPALELDVGSLDGVLASRVFHFLSGDDLELGLKKILKWLKPGGILAIEMMSPFTRPMIRYLIEYQQLKKAGILWPGYFPGAKDFFPEVVARNLPYDIHVEDDEILSKNLNRIGFEVLEIKYLKRSSFPEFSYDGREAILTVARKPLK